MKKLLSTMFAISLATAGGAALANALDPDDDATDFMPNASIVIVSSAPARVAAYDPDDDSTSVMPNAHIEVEQVAFAWDYPTD
jgi:hypothetical protein